VSSGTCASNRLRFPQRHSELRVFRARSECGAASVKPQEAIFCQRARRPDRPTRQEVSTAGVKKSRIGKGPAGRYCIRVAAVTESSRGLALGRPAYARKGQQDTRRRDGKLDSGADQEPGQGDDAC
jgi:hypothetical protein